MISKVIKKMIAGVLTVATTLSMCFAGSTLEVLAAETSVSGVSTVSNMQSDFARGVDISEVIALESSGITYKYLDGTSGDIFDILAGAGVNYVRIRIWNNPYDASSPYKGYGAGNCDLYNAKVLGKRATDAGMQVFIDFHYSDFWADPAKQFAPKAWSDYSLAYKEDAVYNFTYDSLCELLDYGVNVGMVQIGNETNGSMAGVGGLYDGTWNLSSGVASLMQEGCYAVDDINSNYGKSILKVVHFTDLLTNGEWYAKCLNEQGVDYDVFATSFYPMWHGSTDDLASTLLNIAKTYNKKVMVAETAYPYTFTNNDSEGNMVGDTSAMSYADYSVSVSGQAEALHDVFEAVASVNNSLWGYGLGAFYWAPEWIGVDSSTSGTYGTGWASSSSGNYELLYSSSVNYYSTTDRGSAWDNMTLFDANGQAMKSLYVFNDICGNTSTTTSGSDNTADTTNELNANNLTRGVYTSDYTAGDFTIGASSNKYISVESTSTAVEGVSYTQRIKMNGAANSTGRYIKFTTDGAATIDITGASTTTNATRTIRLAKDSVGGTTAGEITVSGTAEKQSISVSEAGTYYLYSTNSGIYIYDVKVTITSASSGSSSSDDSSTGSSDSGSTSDGSTSDSSSSSSDYVSLFYGSSSASNWQQAVSVYTTRAGGSFDASKVTSGGHFYVEYKGTQDKVELVLQSWSGGSSWGKVTMSESGTANGNYYAIYSYDNCVSTFGSSDFSGKLDAVHVGAQDASIEVISLCYDFGDSSSSSSSSGSSSSSSSSSCSSVYTDSNGGVIGLDGTYYIKSVHSGKYLDVNNGSSADGTNIQQYQFNGSSAQIFKLVGDGNGYYSILTACSGYNSGLDVYGWSSANGTNIDQWTYHGGDCQKFQIVQIGDAYAIKTKVSGCNSCLDVYNWSTSNGGNIAQWEYWGGNCQLWYLESCN